MDIREKVANAVRCAGCGAAIWQEDGCWVDVEGSETCGPENPMYRNDPLDPFHEPV